MLSSSPHKRQRSGAALSISDFGLGSKLYTKQAEGAAKTECLDFGLGSELSKRTEHRDMCQRPGPILHSVSGEPPLLERPLRQAMGVGIDDPQHGADTELGTQVPSDSGATLAGAFDCGPVVGQCSAFASGLSSPINPRLPWPRYEPEPPSGAGLFEFAGEDISPTQPFLIHLPSPTQRHVDAVPSHVLPRHVWPEGGMNGGAKGDMPREVAIPTEVQGWWLCKLGHEWTNIPLDQVQGRTIRQERERLGLLSVDTTIAKVFVLSRGGCLQARWDYKFPFTAKDGVLLIIAEDTATPQSAFTMALASRPQSCLFDSPRPGACQGGMPQACEVQQYHSADVSRPPLSVDGKTTMPEAVSMRRNKRPKAPGPMQPKPARGQDKDLSGNGDEATPEGTVLFSFICGWRCVQRQPFVPLGQVLEDEWGVRHEECVITINGRHTSPWTLMSAVPKGTPVRVTAKLKGGGQAHLKKLRELLLAKGVAQDDVASRQAEVVAAIGEGSLSEVFNSFDSWQALKAKCQGKLRIIKQSELKPARPKKADDGEDALQANDPWAEALQHRLLRPEPSFFMTADGSPPTILSSVSHGCTGLAVVDVNEACILAKEQSDLSPDELSVIVLGEPDLPEVRRPHRLIEFPCLDSKSCRLLVKGTLIDLGGLPMRVVGEESKLEMKVMNTACIACEVHRAEYEDWQELMQSPVRDLKKVLNLPAADVLHTWSRKFFCQGKPVSSMEAADAFFIMPRVRAECTEPILKCMVAGLYTSPRSEAGTPDSSYKVIWCPELSIPDLRVLASSTQGCVGVVKSKTGCGVRVKCSEYVLVRKKLFPEWTPQESTPYNASLPLKFELHHVHPAAVKEELQSLLNAVPWKALVIRQSRPKQWIVASEAPLPRDTLLTEHGCILVLPCRTVEEKGVSKGRGQGKKGRNPEWLLGSHPSHTERGRPHEVASAVPSALAPTDIHGPVKRAVLEVEQKMEERFQSLRDEAAATHAIFRQDLNNMRDEFKDAVVQQQNDTKQLSERVNSVESNLAGQLSTFMSTLNQTLAQQSQDLSHNLRSELTHELRQHMGNARKRTPPPSEAEPDADKRARE